MKYPFPVIRHIDDIERHRAADLIHEAFKRGERPNATIVYDYAYMDNQVFPPIGANAFAALARELRGITFDARTGALLSRPYQKFFNAGEREETLTATLPLGEPHLVLEKLDGSMIHAFIQPDGQLVFATRWGVTGIARQAQAWYEALDHDGTGRVAIRQAIEAGWTPIFEWTSPDNVVVVRHDRPTLTLTGLRHRETGEQLRHAGLPPHAAAMHVPLVRADDPVTHWESFASAAMAETQGEGYVLRFDDGHMIKVKNTLYARVHKFKSNLSSPKDAAEIVISGGLDDMLPHLPAFDKAEMEDYRDRLFAQLRVCAQLVDDTVQRARREITTQDPRERQKTFWLSYAAPLGEGFSTCAVDVWNGHRDAMDAVKALVLKHVSTLSRFDTVAARFGLPKLKFGFDGDQ